MIVIDLENHYFSVEMYDKTVNQSERRWLGSWKIEKEIFFFGGWNDNGPLGDIICYKTGIQKNCV